MGLLVIDEEHRFGVRHKEKLKEFRENIDIISMSATPIPRTLAITMNGDLDLTIIDELPKGRKPIITTLTNSRKQIADLTISHIPVILLTAKTDEQSILIGYKTGADAYLPKPFDLETLKQVVMNQLQSRQRIQDKYASQGAVPLPEEVTISYADESFLTKLNRLIEQHISNTALDISLLEGEMGMSRASLFNKMKAITGMGCNEYITKIRMEKAIQYIKESNLTFTEISEKVGYNTASYFSSAFKQYTGMTPTQYRKSQKNG